MLISRFEFKFAASMGPRTDGQISRRRLALSSLTLLAAALLLGSNATGQTATTTSLTVTSGGQTASTIATGTKITLTASVKAGATAITRGLVNFCDATVAYCTDTHVLGSAQITSAGTATLNLRPAPGSHTYKAEFAGTPHTTIPYGPSASSTATLTVTGTLSTTATTLTQSGSPGDYSLNTTVYGFAKPANAGPAGTVSFLDSTVGDSELSTAPLTAGIGPAWVNLTNSSVVGATSQIISVDLNRDGNLDLVEAVNSGGVPIITILLGDGKGNFNPVTGSISNLDESLAAVADFNGDGIPDLLLASSDSLTVLLGNGDGTFTANEVTSFPGLIGRPPVVVADFNGDGIPDVVIGGDTYLTVMLGNGDGTFTAVPTASSIPTAASIVSMVVGDFNGDGAPDLAVLAENSDTAQVYLGNGDGTFEQSSSLNATNAGSTATFAVGDFNGDGKLDLVLTIYGSGASSVEIFLGNGDGTFEPAIGSPVAGDLGVTNVAVGDFNGDGIPDLLLGADADVTDTWILLGNGDGTFTQPPAPSPYVYNYILDPNYVALGDFNNDGLTDIAAASLLNGAAEIFLTAGTYSTASVSGIAVTGTPTPQQVMASYAANGNYAASTSTPTSLQVQAAAPVFSPPPGTITPGQPITITSTTPSALIYYGATGVLQATSPTPYSGLITVAGTGTLTIQAYAVASYYGPSAVVTATYTVVAAYPVPAISSLTPAIATAGGAAFTLTINGSNFVSSSTVYWGSTALTTQYVSATQLTAQVTAAQIAAAGTGAITVQSPAPGGGTSNTLEFEIDSASPGTPPSFTTSTGTVAPGSTATYSVTLPSSATGVTVTCLNLPTGASCSYSAGTLTIVTTSSTPAGTYQITAVFTETLPGAASALIFAPFLLLPLAGLRKKVKKESLWVIAFVAVAICATVSGCGGGGNSGSGGGGGTPAQTHQVTSSATVILTVQ